MRVDFNYLPSEFKNHGKIVNEWKKLIKSCDYTLGHYVEKVQLAFAKYTGAKYCLAVNSGTDALILSLRSLSISYGDEVITSANTFYATAGAVVACGAQPILVDVDDRYQINVEEIQKKISKRTKAIIAVHWGGASPDMKALKKIAKKNNLFLIEDACMGIGGLCDGKHPGTIGDVGAFSLHPIKSLNAIGDGGFFVTNNKKIYEWSKMYRNHGMISRDRISIWGVNMRMQPLQAIVAIEGLKKIDSVINKRNRNAEYLDSKLSNLSDFVLIPKRKKNNRETYSLYMIIVKNRDKLYKFLKKNKIECKIHYPIPLSSQKPYINKQMNSFKLTNYQAKNLITLPIHQYLSKKHLDYMYKKIKAFYAN